MDIEFCTVGYGPEDVLPMPDGSIVTGLKDGRVMRVAPDFATVEELANTGGRPLGLDLAQDGKIVICDVELGLWICDPATGELQCLADTHNGARLNFTNNPCVAQDGAIWFTTSTDRYGFDDYIYDIIENRPTGRLYRYGPDGSLEVKLEKLAFGNGVAIAPDQSSVLVAQTGHGKIVGFDPVSGTTSDVVPRTPGFPDNMSVTPDGKLLVAQVSPFGDDLRKLLDLPFPLRWLLPRLPQMLQPKPEKRIMLGLYEFDGTKIAQMEIEHPEYDSVTGARVAGDWIYLGSINHDRIARMPLAALI